MRRPGLAAIAAGVAITISLQLAFLVPSRLTVSEVRKVVQGSAILIEELQDRAEDSHAETRALVLKNRRLLEAAVCVLQLPVKARTRGNVRACALSAGIPARLVAHTVEGHNG